MRGADRTLLWMVFAWLAVMLFIVVPYMSCTSQRMLPLR